MENTWLISLLVLLISTLLTLLKLKNSHKTHKLPPGPPKLPIIGNLHQLAPKHSLPSHRLADLARVYGPIMHLRIGEVPHVVVSSADTAKEVLKSHDVVLCHRPKVMMAEHVFYNRTDIAMAPYGEYWRQVRKIATLELFTAKRVQFFRHIREEEVTDLLKSIAMEEGSVINLSKKLFGLYFDIMSRLVFNKKGSEQEDFRTLVADVAEQVAGFSICDIYPSFKFLESITGTRSKLQELVKRCDKIVDPIIHDHISKKRLRKGEDHEDLVDVLLDVYKDKDDPSSVYATQFCLTIDNIKAIVLELFGAGSDTSSTIVEWAMSELLRNPKAMEKAQDEVRRVLNLQGKNMVDESSFNELRYLKLVIKETLRLHPPLPLLIPRESMEQCQINGYEIPPKTRIIVNAWAIGKDPEYWPNPKKFDPGRFEESSIEYNDSHFELIPFGAGRRICPGMGLGLANVEHALARLLYHFDWKLPNGIEPQDLNMEETFGIVASRKHDLLVIPIVVAPF